MANLFAFASNPNVTKYTLWEAHRSLDDTVMFVRDYAIACYREGEYEPYAIALRTDNSPIGAIGCRWTSRPNHTMELGYWIAEPYWGQGLACEAINVLLERVERDIEPQRIEARVIEGNLPSVRVLEKCGFVYEGTLRSALLHRGEFKDLVIFSKVRPKNTITPAAVPG